MQKEYHSYLHMFLRNCNGPSHSHHRYRWTALLLCGSFVWLSYSELSVLFILLMWKFYLTYLCESFIYPTYAKVLFDLLMWKFYLTYLCGVISLSSSSVSLCCREGGLFVFTGLWLVVSVAAELFLVSPRRGTGLMARGVEASVTEWTQGGQIWSD